MRFCWKRVKKVRSDFFDTLVKLTDPNPKSKRIYQVGEECHLVFDPDEVHVL